MKTEIIKAEHGVDYSKVVLVKNDLNIIILTNGQHADECFSGMVIFSEEQADIGFYHTNWLKSNFTKITEPITIKFIP